ncbi:uncharacterized protein TNCV_1841551 [Trichonephila clavipes]|nr:uncharacterized protein TNCV_1841551 [Trichonephila clavipes]
MAKRLLPKDYCSLELHGCGNLMIKAPDRGWPCHEFEPSTTKYQLRRAAMYIKSIESSTALPLVWCGSWERGCQLRCRPRYLTMVQNYMVRHEKPSCI